MFYPRTSPGNIGNDLIFLPQCHSTNTVAKEMVRKGTALHGTLIITNHQTAGRGQRGNKWLTEPDKNITCSLVLTQTQIGFAIPFQIVKTCAVALISALSPYAMGMLQIKWPNDILAKGSKLAGILVEMVTTQSGDTAFIVGIGVNVNQTEFHHLNATSLQRLHGKEVPLQHVLDAILNAFEALLPELHLPENGLHETYLNHLLGYKSKLLYKTTDDILEGAIIDIMQDGILILQTFDGVRKFNSSQISQIR